MKSFIVILLVLFTGCITAQKTEDFTWYNAGELTPGGKVNTQSLNPFQRLPDSMKELVRKRVWDLSENPSGVYVNFETNAPEIIINYTVQGPLDFPHMPATGVSGVDLYTYKNHSWKWVKGNYNFQDTISYRFRLSDKDIARKIPSKFRLYLPLYNTISKMEIGVSKHADFKEVPEKNTDCGLRNFHNTGSMCRETWHSLDFNFITANGYSIAELWFFWKWTFRGRNRCFSIEYKSRSFYSGLFGEFYFWPGFKC